VTVRSEAGSGSTFTVYLPLIAAEEKAEDSIMEDIAGGNERILFVDDDPSLAELGKYILKWFGYEVFTFTDSTQALEMFAKNPNGYDLVVTDMTMPEMTGMHLSRAILTIRPEMPIILCTGHSDLIDERKAKEEGIRHFMMKPLRRNELAKIVRNALDEQKARS
jgi:two-component system cell cycle sensor histidine kinase/response regulator CckA